MSHYANQPELLISRASFASQLCKLVAPKHSRGRSESTCKVSELRKMSHYANQPGRSPGAAGWLASMPTLARVATLQTNGTKALPGSVASRNIASLLAAH